MTTLDARATAIVAAVRLGQQPRLTLILDQLGRADLYELIEHLAEKTDIRAIFGQPPLDTETELANRTLALAANRFGVTRDEILSKSRRTEATEARQVTCYALRLAGDLSYPRIGIHVGRDHTTVMHAIAKVGETARLRRIGNDIAQTLGWTRVGEEVA